MRLYDEKKLRELVLAHAHALADADRAAFETTAVKKADAAWIALNEYLKTGEQQNTEVPR